MTDVIGIARIMRPRSMSRELSGTVREILGTCQSVGCTVDGEAPHDLIVKVRNKPYSHWEGPNTLHEAATRWKYGALCSGSKFRAFLRRAAELRWWSLLCASHLRLLRAASCPLQIQNGELDVPDK